MFYNWETIPFLLSQKNVLSKGGEFEENSQKSNQSILPTTISLTLKKPKKTAKLPKSLTNNKETTGSSNSLNAMEIDEEESNGDSEASSSIDYSLIQRVKKNKSKKRKRKCHTVNFNRKL